MRVTQSMLSGNMLRNLSNSYNKMGKLQEQLNTGKKVNRPSDDPVVVMKGMGYRMEVDKVAQFKRNLGEVNNWLDTTDDTLDHVGSALHRAKDLMTTAPNGTLTDGDRKNILEEIKQIRETVQELANTKVGSKYIFSGTKTDTKLYDGGFPDPVPDGFNNEVDIEVFDGVMMTVNTNGIEMFKKIDQMFNEISEAIDPAPPATPMESSELDQFIGRIQDEMEVVLSARADLGARQNRVEMMANRLDAAEGSSKKQMSENEDVDYEKTITEMITEESIHRAALSVGARIIQPSLVDFLR